MGHACNSNKGTAKKATFASEKMRENSDERGVEINNDQDPLTGHILENKLCPNHIYHFHCIKKHSIPLVTLTISLVSL